MESKPDCGRIGAEEKIVGFSREEERVRDDGMLVVAALAPLFQSGAGERDGLRVGALP